MADPLPRAERIILETVFDLVEDEPTIITDADLEEETAISAKVANQAVNNLVAQGLVTSTRKGNTRVN